MSDIRVDTISAADGTSPVTLTKQSAAKAWFEFNSAGIVGSFNTSSFTDVGVGDCHVSLTSAFTDDTYSVSTSNGWRRSLYMTAAKSASVLGFYSTDPLASESNLVDIGTTNYGAGASAHGDLA